MKKIASLVAAGGLALGLAACGGGGNDAEKAVEDYAAAVVDKDYEKICDSVDPELVKTVESQGAKCAEAMEENAGLTDEDFDAAGDIEIVSSEIAEDEKTATVKVKDGEGKEDEVKLVKVDDEWKITF